MKKVRKVEIIFHGYGTKTIIELEELDAMLDKDYFDNLSHTIDLKGKISGIKYFDRKYLSKLKRKRK